MVFYSEGGYQKLAGFIEELLELCQNFPIGRWCLCYGGEDSLTVPVAGCWSVRSKRFLFASHSVNKQTVLLFKNPYPELGTEHWLAEIFMYSRNHAALSHTNS